MTQLVCFEGLGLGTPTHIRRHLLDRVYLKDANVWRGSFMSKGPEILYAPKHIVIGHSMGGASAIDWCKRQEEWDIDLLITLDPRPLHRPYIKPDNVKRAVNFYRDSLWMRGYPVEGAENHIVQCGHTYVPALAVETLREALR